ncbi:hypothetical protein AUC43_19770 [Hymenobacter sedentarius]|uniref:Glycosyltransferase 2-like domain-containing protein n=1 Tax=Hymenobacter sedentarius TaxID=1411621 RepID=A0A0U4AFV1_9BACT|nr:glycosyltransferase [Hymenobacter sedentarius]ALW87116.1 hypothetical protein AUC43_19770 [Hymenobacter sedentarius]
MIPKLVSIIIPCYNYGWVLHETLDSLLAQTHAAWECLIVDDGSTDETRAVAERYSNLDSRFQYIYKRNQGISAARNTGLAKAKGEFIQFLDSDDQLAVRKLEIQVKFLADHEEVDLVYGDARYFHSNERNVLSFSFALDNQEWMPRVEGTGFVLLEALAQHNIMVINAPLLRCEYVRRVGTFNECLTHMEDWEYWIRCALEGGEFAYLNSPDAWSFVRVHPKSTSQNTTSMRKAEVQVRRWFAKKLDDNHALEASQINRVKLNNQALNNAVHDMLHGSVWNGVQEFVTMGHEQELYLYQLKNMAYWLLQRIKQVNTTL